MLLTKSSSKNFQDEGVMLRTFKALKLVLVKISARTSKFVLFWKSGFFLHYHAENATIKTALRPL
jgi:hypothetical protein